MRQPDPDRAERALGHRLRGAAPVALALATLAAGPAPAGQGSWSVDLQAVFADVAGHDQHVLTLREVAADRDASTAVTLDTDAGLAYRGEFQYRCQKWGAGLDYFWFNTTQLAPAPTIAAGAGELVSFEVADRLFTSGGPGEVLFYQLLEDTDLALWTADIYAIRVLAENPKSSLRLQFGLRLGDFDNDYRAVVGVQGVGGARLDASSNYGLMPGPIVGLAAEVRLGRSVLEGYLGQSVIFGTAELGGRSRQFEGPFGETTELFGEEALQAKQDVAIPISELRLGWTYSLGRHLTFGAGVQSSVWWDVPVPPGVIPGPGGDRLLHENTLVVYGLLASIGVTF